MSDACQRHRHGATWQGAEAEHSCVRVVKHPGPCMCSCGALGGEDHSDRGPMIHEEASDGA